MEQGRGAEQDVGLSAPAIIIKVAEPVEAALQVFCFIALFFGHFPPRHPPAPLEMSAGVVIPAWALKAAPEALVCLRLNDGDTRVGIAGGALAFDIAFWIIASELEREATTVVKPECLRHAPSGGENESCSDNNGRDTHPAEPLVFD